MTGWLVANLGVTHNSPRTAALPDHLRDQLGDAWSAFVGIDLEDEQAFFSALEDQSRTLDRCSEEIGRDPKTLRRSLLAFRPLTPWRSTQALEAVVDGARRLGFDEMILYKPADADEMRVFENAAATLSTLKHV